MTLKIRGALAVALLMLGAVGCKRAGGGADSMELVPKEASILASINLDRMRGSKTWADVNEFKNDPDAKKSYDEFVSKTGLDPLTQVNSVTLAMTPDASEKNQMELVVRAQKLDEQKIVAYVKEKQPGKPLTNESYNGKTIYGADDDVSMVFLDDKTLLVAGKAWIKKCVDLSKGTGENIKKNDTVQSLVKKTNTAEAIWAVGVVPAGQMPVPTGGEIKGLSASADFANGFRAEVWAQAPSNDDAKKMADDLQKKIGEASQGQQGAMLAMTGLKSLVDSAKVGSEGAWIHLNLSMSQQQVDDLINRMKGMAQMMKGMGGMGGVAQPPPAGDLPPTITPPPAPTPTPAPKGKKHK